MRQVPMVQKCVGVLLFSVAVTAHMPPVLSESQDQARVEGHLPPPVLSESQSAGRVEGLDRVLPSRADAIYQQMVVFVDPGVAMDTARMMAPLWRLAGNPAFEQSQQFIIQSTFHRRPNRNLVVEIPGRSKPDERIVLAAHVQESGANDNANGCGTLLASALAIQDGIRRGVLAAPARTITFLWVDEIRGSDQWVKDDAARVKRVLAMLSLNMTGEDTAKTGGTFLIENLRSQISDLRSQISDRFQILDNLRSEINLQSTI
ncbi:MAG: M28 family peptidase [Acidobacteriota bacterium]|nr:M28 family peptidase [Acidobacteriota bacterium]